jgi:hypothetical protein
LPRGRFYFQNRPVASLVSWVIRPFKFAVFGK